MSFSDKGLGRRIPKDWSHVLKMSISDLNRPVVKNVEKQLILPTWVAEGKHDQTSYNACTGFGTSLMLAMINEQQCRDNGQMQNYIHYDPFWLWDEAKKADEFPETRPGDNEGSTVHAACSVIQTQGHVLWKDELTPHDDEGVVTQSFGISAYRWAKTIDEIRTAISENTPLAIGIGWYNNFNTPILKNGEYFIGEGDLGILDGGHCLLLGAASDKKQAFGLTNSWGLAYPSTVWISYKTMQRLINEQGEFALVTDK